MVDTILFWLMVVLAGLFAFLFASWQVWALTYRFQEKMRADLDAAQLAKDKRAFARRASL